MSVIDAYIADTPDPAVRARLETLCAVLREELPGADEVISYRMPTFDLHGEHVVHFAPFARHVGFFPTGKGVAAVEDRLTGFKYSRGGIQFPHDKPLPLDLVRDIVNVRLTQLGARR